jgi:D-alanine-D-alanine ligase
MKIAVIYNRDSKNVINLFGQPNLEKIGVKAVRRITDSLKAGGHQVIAVEGDKDLVDRLEDFMPRVLKGERPGMAFNVSYGIQGKARYTHVPSILEMVGIPYVGSSPLAHSLALDKIVTKMILAQHGLPTPAFAVLEARDFEAPEIPFPLIVKPKNEAVSFGIKVCSTLDELRDAAGAIFDRFGQAVLAEQYIEGREVNVGLLGNNPPEALPPVELSFGETGPKVYSYEDKTGRSGRTIELVCPAPLDEELTRHAQDLARRAFTAIGCYDCARVDMRLDESGQLHILEINSLASLGQRGSYVRAAEEAGLDFTALVNRLVEVASARYFGTSTAPRIASRTADPDSSVFSFLTQNRDRIERRVRDWTRVSSRSTDPVGLQNAARHVDKMMSQLGLRANEELSDERAALVWETGAGLAGGTLLVGHLDVPLKEHAPVPAFRRDPERLFGEGIGVSRAPLVMVEFALRALRHVRALQRKRLGVLLYLDEGLDGRYSAGTVRRAMAAAGRVLVVRPGGAGGRIFGQRRGQRRYRLVVEGQPRRPGRQSKRPEALMWALERLERIRKISSSKQRLAVAVVDLRTESFPMLVPHRVVANLLLTYLDAANADRAEEEMRDALGRRGLRWELELRADRPPLKDRKGNRELMDALSSCGSRWDIVLQADSSSWPSVAGLAPEQVPVACGIGPEAQDLYTPQESVQRISLMQRTLLLSEFLLEEGHGA